MKNPKVGDKVRLKRGTKSVGKIIELDTRSTFDCLVHRAAGGYWYPQETLIRIIPKKKRREWWIRFNQAQYPTAVSPEVIGKQNETDEVVHVREAGKYTPLPTFQKFARGWNKRIAPRYNLSTSEEQYGETAFNLACRVLGIERPKKL